MRAVILLLLAQLFAVPKPCPPSIACTIPSSVLLGRHTTGPVSVLADPEKPARWFTAALLVELGVFEMAALSSHDDTVSQWTQSESRKHSGVRWAIVGAGGLLVWHLAWGFPW